jgi:tetratricopeptide (TPR) repeat protein
MTQFRFMKCAQPAVPERGMLDLRTSFGRVVVSLAMALFCALCAPAVFAAGRTDPMVAQLKRQGDAAIEAGKYDVALVAYSKALAIEPAPALHYNRGRALQGLGRNAEALEELEQFESTAPKSLKSAVPDLEGMIRLVQSQIAELSVKCDAPGAVLRVAGSALVLPLQRALRFDPGNVDVELVAPGYEPWRDQLTLGPGERRELVPRLTQQDLRGTLVVTSSVSGAFVQVDGKALGTVPVELRLAPGEHSIALRHAGYEPATSRIVLRPNEHRSFALTLKRTPRFYERGWFWTGVGAVVTTGAVVGIALATEKPAGKGDIPPGQITANLTRW